MEEEDNVGPDFIRELYNQVRTPKGGAEVPAFLKLFYQLQTNTFTILDAYQIFYCSLEPGTHQLSFKGFSSCVYKIIKIRYGQKLSSIRELKENLIEIQQQDSYACFFDEVRCQIVSNEVISLLNQYYVPLSKVFKSNACISESDNMNTMVMPLEKLIELMTYHLICPQLLSVPKIKEVVYSSGENFLPFSKKNSNNDIQFPHFVEILCRLSIFSQESKSNTEGRRIKKAIEIANLTSCLKNLMDNMKLEISISATNEDINEKTPLIQSLFTDLSDRLLDLEIKDNNQNDSVNRKSTVNIRKKLKSTYSNFTGLSMDIILIREVLAVPDLPREVTANIEAAFRYHDINQYELALDTLAEAECNLKLIQPKKSINLEADVFFLLAKGNVKLSQKMDSEAMQFYLNAQKLCSELPTGHPGIPLTFSCLGCVSFYSQRIEAALKCFKIAVSERHLTLGENAIDTCSSKNNLACCFYAIGEDQKAMFLFKQVFGILKSVLGMDHPRTNVVLRNYEKARLNSTKMEIDPQFLKKRTDSQHIIPGGQFYINAFVRKPFVSEKVKKKGKKKSSKEK